MSLIKTIFVITLLLSAQYSFAACDTVRCTGKVSFIFVNENDIRVLMDQDMSMLNCTLSADKYATLQTNHPLLEEMFKTLLAGHMSQNPKMSIRIAEGSARCDIMYVTSSLGQGWQPPATGGGNPSDAPLEPGKPLICSKKPYLPQCQP